MTVALVTGVAGFCGKHLVQRLRSEKDIRVCGVDICSAFSDEIVLDDYLSADLRDNSQISIVLKKVRPDLLFHLIGMNSAKPLDMYEVNLLSGIKLLEAVKELSPHTRVLIVGSAAEYGDQLLDAMPLGEDRPCYPKGIYAQSKYALTLAALDYVHRYGLKVVVARPFNIIGPGVPPNLVVGAFIERIKMALENPEEAEICVGNLDSERDFVDVKDVVDAYVDMMHGELWGEVFNICSGKPITIDWILKTLLTHSKRPIRVKQDPSLMRSSEVKVIYGSWQKAHMAFGYEPNLDFETVLYESWRHRLGD